MSERLSVAVRVRPFLPHESPASCVAVRENQISIGESKTFAFDRVFDMSATSDDVYVMMGQPLADAFLSGYHASTIAYGQTGAGKTFTMAALLNDTVQEIFCRLAEEEEGSEAGQHDGGGSSSGNKNVSALATSGAVAQHSPTPPFTMSLTVLEVYNEAVGDLLSRHGGLPFATAPPGNGVGLRGGGGGGGALDKKNGQSQRSGLQLREDPAGGVYAVGLTEIAVDSEARLLALIDDAIGNRKTASTLMNATSSRSHCVITLTLQRRGLCSRCCFVDLAGSERLKKSLGFGAQADRHHGYNNNSNNNATNNGGNACSPTEPSLAPNNSAVRMREGININSGLLALGNVIVALCERKAHVPYRSSKLTRLLQPMLEGHSRTAMIACVAPLESSLEETLNTLKYADRAKRIHINPHLAVAVTNSAADAQQLIALLRHQLEEAQRRLATFASHHQSNESHSAGAGATATSSEVEELRELLAQERKITKRLENDLFSAEYTAMVEVEKRKALEARVAQLEEGRASASHDDSGHRAGSERGSAMATPTRTARVSAASATPPSPRARLTMNMARLQQLEEERESLAAMRAKRVQDTQRLEATLAAESLKSAVEGRGEEAEEDAVVTQAHSADHLSTEQLNEEIQLKETQIANLQRENEEVSAQLVHFERALQDTLTEKARLQEELRRAEALLEKSAMERDQKESEKETLRAAYLERIRKAEVKATEYRRRVREAEQAVRARQDSLDRTRQLQDRVAQLREELSRQRVEVRSAKKHSDQLSLAHQQELLQLQKQLQLSTAQVTQLHQRMARKDAAIAKARKQLTEQQQQGQQQQGQPTPPQSPSPPPQTSPPPPPHPPLTVALHKIPPGKQTSSRRISLKQQPPSSSTDTPPSGTSPPRITKRRVTLSSPHRSPHHSRDDAAQALINRELLELERMEKELAELLEYREVLLSAQSTDAPKWHRAREGFTRRLAAIESELAHMDAATPAHANLLQESHDVRAKLQQLQAYRHMFEDADEQLAEFDNRIENLNEARRYHLQRIRKLQQSSARRAFPNDQDDEQALNQSSSSAAAGTGLGDGETPLPSVRDIRATRLACSVRSLSHKSTTSDTPPPPRSLPQVLKSGSDSAAYTAALELQVARLTEETGALQALLKAA